eukprot:TRINITY_DN8778_c0_g1_i5.p1 TRINITY_DN8778_c0_g1~~TRINITY_DN8778_c0_g1_i5.p1  ORF type:complete len:245 (+),score=44.88 TRINITY_DN8778_c0_g1_i5:65-736(+)
MTHITIVTGAAGIVGNAVIERLLSEGRKVVGIDFAPLQDPRLAMAFGGTDLSNETSIIDICTQIEGQLGGIDAVVNIAGGFEWEMIGNGNVETWDRMYNINVRTALITCRSALAALIRSQGAIVNIGANAALRATSGMGAYTASKSAVIRLTEALAEELKDSGVRANVLLPSIVDTPRNRADMPDADFDRWVSPADLANVVAFLLSSSARAITGAAIPVTGRV